MNPLNVDLDLVPCLPSWILNLPCLPSWPHRVALLRAAGCLHTGRVVPSRYIPQDSGRGRSLQKELPGRTGLLPDAAAIRPRHIPVCHPGVPYMVHPNACGTKHSDSALARSPGPRPTGKMYVGMWAHTHAPPWTLKAPHTHAHTHKQIPEKWGKAKWGNVPQKNVQGETSSSKQQGVASLALPTQP